MSAGRSPSRPRLTNAALAALLFMAAVAPRFFRLEMGLRHAPDFDESIFVENALGMIERGDWNHHFYEYPGLLLWLLRIALELTGARGADAYGVARALVALASALTVPLVFAAVSSWISRPVGVVVALMLALSPLDIEVAHMFRPDAVLAPLLFAAMAFASPGNSGPSIRLAWITASIATAMKFSAALVFVPLLLATFAARVTLPRVARLSGLALAIFAILSPFTFLAGADSVAGMGVQLDYHYGSGPHPTFLPTLIGFLTDTLTHALSIPGVALVVWGIVVAWRERARWSQPWIVFPAIWIFVFSTSGVRFGRFVVPVLGALAVLAGLGLRDLLARSRPLALAVAGLALALLSLGAGAYLAAIREPLTLDLALDWLSRSPGVVSVGSSLEELGALDNRGPEITPLRGFRGDAFVAQQFDALVLPAGAATPPGFTQAGRFTPVSVHNGPDIQILRALPRPPLSMLDLGRVRVRSSAMERMAKLTDGQVSTRWGSDISPAWIELEWAEAVRPSRLELVFGAVAPNRDLAVTVSDDSGGLEWHALRPPVERQHPGIDGRSQRLAWPPRPTRRLRIEFGGQAPLRIGELRVFSEDPAR